ncbi:MAG: hypothetical protein AB1540_09735 [Bdellovibrionota bacterium]
MRHLLRRAVAVVSFLVALGIAGNAVCLNAEASYGLTDALETMGIATGIGTVLGLSTIAFYDEPSAHMGNALIGAGAGLIVGLGVAAYLFAESSDEQEIDPEELLPREKKSKDSDQKTKDQVEPGKPNKGAMLSPRRSKRFSWGTNSNRFMASVPSTHALLAARSNWVVAVRVLELRF